jgi:PBP superfamily domain/MoeA N-terminal region (domain I and II)
VTRASRFDNMGGHWPGKTTPRWKPPWHRSIARVGKYPPAAAEFARDLRGHPARAYHADDTYGASEESPRRLRVGGEEIPTGAVPRLVVEPGTASPIATGGMLPRGADAVLMVEHARVDGECLEVLLHRARSATGSHGRAGDSALGRIARRAGRGGPGRVRSRRSTPAGSAERHIQHAVSSPGRSSFSRLRPDARSGAPPRRSSVRRPHAGRGGRPRRGESLLPDGQPQSGKRNAVPAGRTARRPPGFAVEVRSHTAVAAAVSQGRADWGVAVEPVARAYGLAFLPLRAERYDFAIPADAGIVPPSRPSAGSGTKPIHDAGSPRSAS